MNTPKTPGRLFLVPTPLDFGCAEQAPVSDVLPVSTLAIAASLVLSFPARAQFAAPPAAMPLPPEIAALTEPSALGALNVLK